VPGLSEVTDNVSELSGVNKYPFWELAPVKVQQWLWPNGEMLFDSMTCAIVATLIGLAFITKENSRTVLILCTLTVLPIVLVFIYSRLAKPIFISRVFIGSATLLPMLAAIAAFSARTRLRLQLGRGLLLMLLVLEVSSAYFALQFDRREEWRDVAAYIGGRPSAQGNGKVLLAFLGPVGQFPFDYYFNRFQMSSGSIDETGIPMGLFSADPPATNLSLRTAEAMVPFTNKVESGDYDALILMVTHESSSDPNHLVRSWLRQRGFTIQNHHFEGVEVLEIRRL
jgi:hypothetical protein